MIVMNYNVLRIVMAELVRQRLDAEGEGEQAARLVKVTGYHPHEVERYPGTSSCWIEHYVDLYWVDDAEGFQVYQWRGTEKELHDALNRMIDDY